MKFKNKKNKPSKQIRFVDGKPTIIHQDSIYNELSQDNVSKGKTKKLKCNKNLVLGIIFIIFVIITPFFFEKAGIYYFSESRLDTTFLKVWHIDSFEGGSGNRADFINKVAMDYHKNNSNIFIIVQTLNEEELESAIQAGDRPDIISFSHHTANIFNAYLQELDVKVDVREDILQYGQKGNKTYAVPWNMSGYCLIGNASVDSRVLQTLDYDTAYSYDGGQYNYLVGMKGSYAQVAMNYNTNAKCDLSSCDKEIFDKTPYQAYCDFVENKGAVLLGTARDFYRIKNRVSLGNMAECKYVPLGKFTDLIQYMGVLNSVNQLQAESFIEYMVSTQVQKSLSDIGLFSVNKLKLYSDEDYRLFEDKLNMNIDSFSIFESEENKSKIYAQAINNMS